MSSELVKEFLLRHGYESVNCDEREMSGANSLDALTKKETSVRFSIEYSHLSVGLAIKRTSTHVEWFDGGFTLETDVAGSKIHTVVMDGEDSQKVAMKHLLSIVLYQDYLADKR